MYIKKMLGNNAKHNLIIFYTFYNILNIISFLIFNFFKIRTTFFARLGMVFLTFLFLEGG